jgi:hypothetical protein
MRYGSFSFYFKHERLSVCYVECHDAMHFDIDSLGVSSIVSEMYESPRSVSSLLRITLAKLCFVQRVSRMYLGVSRGDVTSTSFVVMFERFVCYRAGRARQFLVSRAQRV